MIRTLQFRVQSYFSFYFGISFVFIAKLFFYFCHSHFNVPQISGTSKHGRVSLKNASQNARMDRRMLDVCILPQTIYLVRVESKMRVESGSKTIMGHVAAPDIKRNVCLPLRKSRNEGTIWIVLWNMVISIIYIKYDAYYIYYLHYSAWQCSGNTQEDFSAICFHFICQCFHLHFSFLYVTLYMASQWKQ